MDFIREFYEANKDWLVPSVSALVSALIGYFTAMIRTRKSRLESTFDGYLIYDDNDLVWIQGDYTNGRYIPLGQLDVVRKGKNADEKSS